MSPEISTTAAFRREVSCPKADSPGEPCVLSLDGVELCCQVTEERGFRLMPFLLGRRLELLVGHGLEGCAHPVFKAGASLGIDQLAKARHGPVFPTPTLPITLCFKVRPGVKKRFGKPLGILESVDRQVDSVSGLHLIRVVKAVTGHDPAIELRDAVKIIIEFRRLERRRHGALPCLLLFLDRPKPHTAAGMRPLNGLRRDQVKKGILGIPSLELFDPRAGF